MFVRVKDRDTGHEFDTPENDPLIGHGLDLVKSDRYPPAHTERPPKYHTNLAGRSVTRAEAPRPVAPRQSTKKETKP